MSNIDVSLQLDGLVPFEKYDYVIEGLGGNWPCVATPVSGTIRPYGSSVTLDAIVNFCTTKTSCPSGTVGLLSFNNSITDPYPNLYTTIRVALKPESFDYTLYSDAKIIRCDNCFSQPAITTQNSVTLTATNGNQFVMTTNIVGLQPNYQYTYNISSIDANWPIKVTPSSGTIEVTKDRIALSNNIMFCLNSGLCPVGQTNVMNYMVDPTCSKAKNLFGVLQLELSSSELGVEPILSNPISLYCQNCLPTVDLVVPLFSETTNSNIYDLPFTVNNLIPGHTYSYEFVGVNGNWPVTLSSMSGTFVANDADDTIITSIIFCPTTGVCQSAGKTVMPYTLDNSCILGSTNRFIDMKLKISSETCDIPDIVSDTINVVCDDCIEKLQVTDLIDTVIINNSNLYTVEAAVTGLKPNHTYNYSFDAVSANWPVYLSSNSGTFISKSTSYNIESNLVFCASTGVCQSLGKTVLPYILDEGCILYNSPQSVKLQLTVSPVTCDQESAVDETTIICDNCLPEISIGSVDEITLSSPNNNLYSLTHNVSGLIENQQYSYVYNGVQSNWPTIISPVSGSFLARSASHSLESQLMFCYPQNLCPSGTNGLFNYTLDNLAQKTLKKNILSTQLQLTVTPDNCGLPPTTSDVFTLNCSGCLPAFSYSSINFTDTPELSLAGPCCTGMKAVSIDVSGTVPGDKYTYLFDSASTDVSFTPSSGVVYFGGDGAGSVNTIMNVNLVDSQQIVISCALTHYNSDITTIDFLAVKCSGACAT